MDKKTNRKKTSPKKKMLIILLSFCVFVITFFVVSYVIDSMKKDEELDFVLDYDFYDADFDENIYEDEVFKSSTENSFIEYGEKSTSKTVGLSQKDIESNPEGYSEDLQFMVKYIYTIVDGDHELYNSFFSEEYYSEGGKAKEPFTMQRLKKVKLIKDRQETDDGYVKYYYELEYAIDKNNGTFRNDIGDGSRKQFIIVTNRHGELLIDAIETQIIQSK